jgi:hypothetical protein
MNFILFLFECFAFMLIGPSIYKVFTAKSIFLKLAWIAIILIIILMIIFVYFVDIGAINVIN